MTHRPEQRLSRTAASWVVLGWLLAELGDTGWPEPAIVEDGETGWAFFVLGSDTTSYVHPDGTVEWYGTAWHPSAPKRALPWDFYECAPLCGACRDSGVVEPLPDECPGETIPCPSCRSGR